MKSEKVKIWFGSQKRMGECLCVTKQMVSLLCKEDILPPKYALIIHHASGNSRILRKWFPDNWRDKERLTIDPNQYKYLITDDMKNPP